MEVVGTWEVPFLYVVSRSGQVGQRIGLQGVASLILQTTHIVIKLLKTLTTCCCLASLLGNSGSLFCKMLGYSISVCRKIRNPLVAGGIGFTRKLLMFCGRAQFPRDLGRLDFVHPPQ
jgi:hypothetical protein